MKKLVGLILTAVLLTASVFGISVNAVSSTDSLFSIKVLKYANGTYKEVSEVSALDSIVVQVSADSEIKDIAGMSFTLFYDSTSLSFRKQSANCFISDKKADFNARNVGASKNKKAHVNAVWDTSSKNTSVSGLIFSFGFDVLANTTAQTSTFNLTINNLFKADKNQTEISSPAVTDKTVVVKEFDLSPFEKLKGEITYSEESLNNIIAAETIFRSFNSNQAKAFAENHKDLYDALSKARATYNKLAQQAAQEEVLKESKKFVSDFSDLWQLSENDPSVINKESRIVLAKNTYDSLSDAAKTRISTVYPQKISALFDAVDSFKEDVQTAEEFRNGEFKLLWEIDEATLGNTYTELFTIVDNAKIMYNGMSDFAKSLVSDLGEKLNKIEELMNKYLQADKAAAALREKTNAFMKKWSRVFTLNKANVKAEDKSAIEMTIEDYEALDKDVKEAMASRINNIKMLLAVIDSYNDTEDNTPIGNDKKNTETVIKTVTKTIKVKSDDKNESKNSDKNVKSTVKTIYSSLNKSTLYLSLIVLFGLLISLVPIMLLKTLNTKIKLLENNEKLKEGN